MKEYIVPIYDDSQDYDEIFVGQIRNDAVAVVRCKDCKNWNPNGIGICKLHDIRPTPLMMDNWFCADGKVKKDD